MNVREARIETKAQKNIFSRALTSLRTQGLGTTLYKCGVLLADRLFDVRYGVNTCGTRELGELTIRGGNKERGHCYQPSRVILLRKLFHAIEPVLPPDRVLVDMGSGKGRVLLVASEFGFRVVKGVEFARELCETAVRNCSIYKARTGVKSQFQVIESDAANYEVKKQDNVFFLFNPFDETILGRVLNNIIRSLRRRDRKVLLIYKNPLFDDLIERETAFRKIRQFDFWGTNLIVYSN